mmetsp:Transcript_14162/g.34917  ORF Transcript_14162/g.34917 Transcript_14162/m.34917 type:complete len:215 (-) Transcript_14162:1825-2469(-)
MGPHAPLPCCRLLHHAARSTGACGNPHARHVMPTTPIKVRKCMQCLGLAARRLYSCHTHTHSHQPPATSCRRRQRQLRPGCGQPENIKHRLRQSKPCRTVSQSNFSRAQPHAAMRPRPCDALNSISSTWEPCCPHRPHQACNPAPGHTLHSCTARTNTQQASLCSHGNASVSAGAARRSRIAGLEPCCRESEGVPTFDRGDGVGAQVPHAHASG